MKNKFYNVDSVSTLNSKYLNWYLKNGPKGNSRAGYRYSLFEIFIFLGVFICMFSVFFFFFFFFLSSGILYLRNREYPINALFNFFFF
jgi:hypothetical protein